MFSSISAASFGAEVTGAIGGCWVPSNEMDRIQRDTVSGWTPIFRANARRLSPESWNSRTN